MNDQVVNEDKNIGTTVVDRKTGQGFTPGPWVLSQDASQEDAGEWNVESADGAWSICEIAGYAGANNLPDPEESNANARLIAAAPALYEALTALATHTHLHQDCPRPCKWLANARTALALVNKPDTNSANSDRGTNGPAS